MLGYTPSPPVTCSALSPARSSGRRSTHSVGRRCERRRERRHAPLHREPQRRRRRTGHRLLRHRKRHGRRRHGLPERERYADLPGRFQPGQQIEVSISDDRIAEGNETFRPAPQRAKRRSLGRGHRHRHHRRQRWTLDARGTGGAECHRRRDRHLHAGARLAAHRHGHGERDSRLPGTDRAAGIGCRSPQPAGEPRRRSPSPRATTKMRWRMLRRRWRTAPPAAATAAPGRKCR